MDGVRTLNYISTQKLVIGNLVAIWLILTQFMPTWLINQLYCWVPIGLTMHRTILQRVSGIKIKDTCDMVTKWNFDNKTLLGFTDNHPTKEFTIIKWKNIIQQYPDPSIVTYSRNY